ncbi:MAG TPA: hypothetical protein VKY85_14960 [Candidatus Angelobacter sp.]|nr:hypothetical protein [Candidatus Angelobacter sp.]
MMLPSRILLPLGLAVTITLSSPVDRSGRTGQARLTAVSVQSQNSTCSDQPQPGQVDLCCMAARLVNHQPHSQVRLSYSNRDQANFFCSSNQFYSVDQYVKTGNILPDSPNAPFAPADLQRLEQPSNSARLSGAPLQQAVGQNYKFSFTIYADGPDQPGTQYDPHLIVIK